MPQRKRTRFGSPRHSAVILSPLSSNRTLQSAIGKQGWGG